MTTEGLTFPVLFKVGREAMEAEAEKDFELSELALDKLIQCALAGDKDAFRAIVERYQDKVLSIAFSVVKNRADAEDIVQETFIRLYEKLESFRSESSFYTWLYRITVNVALDYTRKASRKRELSILDDEPGASAVVTDSVFAGTVVGPAEHFDRSELGAKLKESFASLSPEHRAVLYLREVEGLSYSEISDAVGCSLGTVMSRLFHARRKMQSLLAEYAEKPQQLDNQIKEG